MKFQLSAPPAVLPHSRKKLRSSDVGMASGPPYSFLRAFGSKNGGTEATATVFWTRVLRIPYPIVYQCVTPFFPPNLQMKFQLSSPPALAPFKKETSREKPEAVARELAVVGWADRVFAGFRSNRLRYTAKIIKSMGYVLFPPELTNEVSA